MRAPRLISVLSVGLFASVTVVAAQPKKADDKKTPAKPKDTKAAAGSGSATAAGSGSAAAGGSGSAVDMPEDPPPSDMEGKDENPGAPKGATIETEVIAKAPPPKMKRSGYPIEEVLRPITMPKQMSEVSIGPHMEVDPYDSGLTVTDALRARYGITDKVQLGVTYLFAGVYDDPATPPDVNDSVAVHGGKAVGIDLTVMLKDWVGLRLAIPMYISPFAMAVQAGVPLKFRFGEKFAVGGLDDLLTIKAKTFPPTFYQEEINAAAAFTSGMNTIQSDGSLRFSAFGIYQYRPKTALVGKLGLNFDDFSGSTVDNGNSQGLTTFMRLGVDYTIRKYLDLGVSLGFDNLARAGSFGPAGLLNFRI